MGSTYVTCSATRTSVSSSEKTEVGDGDLIDRAADDPGDPGGT